MKDRFKRENVLTIPNIISFIRILFIPIFVWVYLGKKDYSLAAFIIIVSFLSDVLDGIIARKTGAVSDLGKFLDPLADKLTQVVIIVCLATRYPLLWVLAIIFFLKEILLFWLGLYVYRKTDSVSSAKWYGKIVTFLLMAVMLVLLLFQNIPQELVTTLISICIGAVVLTFLLYVNFFLKKLKMGK